MLSCNIPCCIITKWHVLNLHTVCAFQGRCPVMHGVQLILSHHMTALSLSEQCSVQPNALPCRLVLPAALPSPDAPAQPTAPFGLLR